MQTADRTCERHARRQGGFVTREQCIEAGLTSRAIEVRLRRDGWVRWLPRVFLLPGVAPDAGSKLLAALLWAGPEAVLSHDSAAWVHKLEGSTAPRKAELYVTNGKSNDKVTTYRFPTGASLARIRVKGLRVTRVERTLSDLCPRWTPSQLGRGMDDALRRGLTNLDRLVEEAATARAERRAGAAVVRRLVAGRDHRDAKVRSRFETMTLRLLNEIEPPQADHVVRCDAKNLWLDFAYPDLMLAIECQSIRWHLGEEAFKADMARHRRLSAMGWMVLFVCWDDVVFARERLKLELAEALRTRRAFMRPELLPR